MSDEHPYAKPAAKSSIQKSGHCLLLPDVFTTVTEPLGQGGHHVLVVLHQRPGGRVSQLFCVEYLLDLLEYGGVLGDIVEVQKLRKVIEDVESSDVELVLRGKISIGFFCGFSRFKNL